MAQTSLGSGSTLSQLSGMVVKTVTPGNPKLIVALCPRHRPRSLIDSLAAGH
jgi:hypothetical protein